MKKIGISILFALVAIVSVFFGYFMTRLTDDDEPISVEYVYEMAKDAGYSGTLQDFINEFKGAVGNDGRGIQSAEINSEGHLIITYTDLTVVDAGVVHTDSVTLTPTVADSAVNSALMSSVSIYAKVDTDSYATGSGVIYKLDKTTGDAYIITNYHVLSANEQQKISSEISVYLSGLEYPMYALSAKYVGGSSSYDIAVLKIEGSELLKGADIEAAILGNSELVSIADTVMAVGNANGDGISLTLGYINIESENRYINTGSQGGSIFMRVIRTDAAVNNGNSGGGLYNERGELIGIVTAKDRSTGSDNVAYSVPINVAAAVADNIIYYCDSGMAKNGKILKLGLSLEVKSVSLVYDEVSGERIKRETVAIKEITQGSVAERVGLQPGDVIKSVSVDGRSIEITRVYQAPEMTLLARAGSTITYTVLRAGEQLSFEIFVPSTLVDIP